MFSVQRRTLQTEGAELFSGVLAWRKMAAASQPSLSFRLEESMWNSPTLLARVCVLNGFHTRARVGRRRVPRCPLALEGPPASRGRGPQPGGHSSSQGSGAWVPSARSGLAGLPQAGLPVRGPCHPGCLSGACCLRSFWKPCTVRKWSRSWGGVPRDAPACVWSSSLLCAGPEVYREEGREGKEKGPLWEGCGSGAGMRSGPRPAGS